MSRRNNNTPTAKTTTTAKDPALQTTQPEAQKAAEAEQAAAAQEPAVDEQAEAAAADAAVQEPAPANAGVTTESAPKLETDAAKTLVQVMERYLQEMDLGREIDPRTVGVVQQRQLALAVVAAVAEPDRKQFQSNMAYLLENIRENRTGVFSDAAIFRWYDIAQIKERREIEAILTVLINTLDSSDRQRKAKMLLGGDFTRRLNPVRAEQISRNLRSFYNVSA